MSNSSAFINIPPTSGGGDGVSSLNSLTGDIELVAGSGIGLTPSGNNITITASSGGGNVTGPGSSTTNAISTYSDTTGQLLSNTDLIYSSDTLNNSDTTTGSSTTGPLLTIRAGNQTVASATGAGASLTIKSGSATGAGSSGNSGTVIVTTGTTVGGSSGGLQLQTANALAGPTTHGGSIIVKPGNSNTTSVASQTSLLGGTNTGSGAGGQVLITGGFASGSGSGGTVIISGGATSGGGSSGTVEFTTGNSSTVAMRISVAGSNDVIFGGTTGTNLLWNTDGNGSIGSSGAARPENIFAINTFNLASLTPSTVVFSDSTSNLVSTGIVGAVNGGTGIATLTPYSLLTGGTTSTGALQQVSSVGTSGYVLTSNGAGALPTWQSGGSGGANQALSNLSSVAMNQSLTFDATLGPFSIGYVPNTTNDATAGNDLIIQAQEKTIGPAAAGDTIIWGGITGTTDGDYGLVRIRTGGGAYPSYQKDWVFDFDLAGSTQMPGNLYLGTSKTSFLNLGDGLHINYAGIEVIGLTRYGFIETDNDLIFPNDINGRQKSAIGVIRQSGSFVGESWPPDELQLQSGIVLGAVQGGGTAVATPNQGQVVVVTGTPLTLTADSVAMTAVLSTTLTGAAGTAVCSQPFSGASYKKVMVYLNGYTDTATQTYTFPVAFIHTPTVYGLSAGITAATVTSTTVKFTSTILSGFVFLEGF